MIGTGSVKAHVGAVVGYAVGVTLMVGATDGFIVGEGLGRKLLMNESM
jgi:hypothetical protein